MDHARKREAAVGIREKRVRRRETSAPDLNADLLNLSLDMQKALESTNLFLRPLALDGSRGSPTLHLGCNGPQSLTVLGCSPDGL